MLQHKMFSNYQILLYKPKCNTTIWRNQFQQLTCRWTKHCQLPSPWPKRVNASY